MCDQLREMTHLHLHVDRECVLAYLKPSSQLRRVTLASTGRSRLEVPTIMFCLASLTRSKMAAIFCLSTSCTRNWCAFDCSWRTRRFPNSLDSTLKTNQSGSMNGRALTYALKRSIALVSIRVLLCQSWTVSLTTVIRSNRAAIRRSVASMLSSMPYDSLVNRGFDDADTLTVFNFRAI